MSRILEVLVPVAAPVVLPAASDVANRDPTGERMYQAARREREPEPPELKERNLSPAPAEASERIYTELQPYSGKGMPNCDKWLTTNFSGIPVSHSFDYGPTQASRVVGMKELGKALTQVRKGNLPK